MRAFSKPEVTRLVYHYHHERIAEIISQKSSLKKVEVEGFFQQGKSIGSKIAMEKGLAHHISEFSVPANNQFAIIG